MSKKTLVGKNVTLYLDGGWELSGEVKEQDDEKIIMQDGDILHMVIRKKVCCVSMATDNRKVSKTSTSSTRGAAVDTTDFPMNRLTYDESALSIPRSILGNPSLEADDDFAVTFSSDKSSASGISFGSEEDDSE